MDKNGVFLLSIGDELLDGRTANSNAVYFGEQLRIHGISVAEVRCVSDRIEDIVEAIRYGKNFSLVVATGGLGPTNDDRTMEAAAKAFRRKLVITKASKEHVVSRYKARGLEMNEHRMRLARVPERAKILQNLVGTAPGVQCVEGKSHFFFLAGVPAECRPLFDREILPRALKLRKQKLVRREFWRSFGLPESAVYQLVEPIVSELEKKYPDSFRFGVHISFPCIDLTFEVWQQKGKKCPSFKEIEAAVESITEIMKNVAFTRERETLVECVMKLLLTKKKTLATAESCTGGWLGKMLTDIPGSSAAYLGGVVSYANSAKETLLEVPAALIKEHGAVSEAVVRKMSENIRQQLGADYSLALSGVSGPDGGSEKKPVGTVHVALSSKAATETLHQVIMNGRGSREQNRLIAAHLALDALRLSLLKK
jgi:nicotinamide-nucleotide amidase